MDPLARDALGSSKHKYECRFESAITPIKRNLLFVSVLSVAALFVTPKDGIYSVNLGVVTGVIDNPILIFLGLLLVCFYHLYHLWINCSQTIVTADNFGGAEKVYMNELASLHAYKDWRELVKQHSEEDLALGTFVESPLKPREGGGWKVRSTIEGSRLNGAIRGALKAHKHFQFGIRHEIAEIDYLYEPKSEDYVFLSVHKNQFWLTKKKEFIVYSFPMLLGFLAIVLLGIRTYSSLKH